VCTPSSRSTERLLPRVWARLNLRATGHVGRCGGEEFGAPACACSDFSRLPTLRPCASVNACRSRVVKRLFAFARADAWPSRALDNLSAKTVTSRGRRCPPPSRRVRRFAGRKRRTMSLGETYLQLPPSSWIAPTHERPTCSSALSCCAYGETSAATAVAAAAAAAAAVAAAAATEAAAVVAAVWFGCYVRSRGVSRGLTLDGLRKHRDEEPYGVPARGRQARIHPVHQVSFSASLSSPKIVTNNVQIDVLRLQQRLKRTEGRSARRWPWAND